MKKQLQMDMLKADLAAVEALLSARSEDDDPVGCMQLALRKDELQKELRSLKQIDVPRASVGLFFGGRPVIASKGIQANFACQAVMQFQDIVVKRFASLQTGPLPSRGPIPFKDNAQLMITDVTRGSFGFVLEEEVEEDGSPSAPLQQAMLESSDLIYRMASPDDGIFETLSDDLDDRVLGAVKNFFRVMDEGGATLRVVQGDKKISLSSDAINRGKIRTSDLEIAEKDEELKSGTLFILPASRKFELHIDDNEIVKGGVDSGFLKDLNEDDKISRRVGTDCSVRLRVKEFVQRNSVVQTKYTLIGFE